MTPVFSEDTEESGRMKERNNIYKYIYIYIYIYACSIFTLYIQYIYTRLMVRNSIQNMQNYVLYSTLYYIIFYYSNYILYKIHSIQNYHTKSFLMF